MKIYRTLPKWNCIFSFGSPKEIKNGYTYSNLLSLPTITYNKGMYIIKLKMLALVYFWSKILEGKQAIEFLALGDGKYNNANV